VCVFNKTGEDGKQITICLHVDDLCISCENKTTINELIDLLTDKYKEVTVTEGRVINYLGMTFDFTVPGEARVTMAHCVDSILSGCGVHTTAKTPAAPWLFEVRDSQPKATPDEAEWFHTHVAKMLWLAKRARPECLVAVSFLSTRVTKCDRDDLNKLKRLLGYLRATRERGIVLRIGNEVEVRAYIDAAYGIHTDCGKSHTGCAIVVGESGPVDTKSSRQSITTKSSTEAELVALSDTASRAIHLRNFIIHQGYDVGPAIIYQDNMSTLALIKRGRPGAEGSRHIAIRHFWLKERVEGHEVSLEHLSTQKMGPANVLTKPVQGGQFVQEREMLTNWK
jgi:hypothetical protein